jgi:hypothetical protein
MERARIGMLGAIVLLLGLAAPFGGTARAQQFNSDSWIAKDHGTGTIILTTGQRTTMWMTTLSLISRWEFTAAAYIYNRDADRSTSEGHSTSVYAKYMFWNNDAKTGGGAIKAGMGVVPSYTLESVTYKEGSHTFWSNAPITLPFFDNRLSWDLMPGVSATLSYPTSGQVSWAFTYSSRIAWYPFSPKLALVGEAYGTMGQATVSPDYKAGLRWEPDVYTNIALTYGGKFDGGRSQGVELGIMLFSPPFFCIGECKK